MMVVLRFHFQKTCPHSASFPFLSWWAVNLWCATNEGGGGIFLVVVIQPVTDVIPSHLTVFGVISPDSAFFQQIHRLLIATRIQLYLCPNAMCALLDSSSLPWCFVFCYHVTCMCNACMMIVTGPLLLLYTSALIDVSNTGACISLISIWIVYNWVKLPHILTLWPWRVPSSTTLTPCDCIQHLSFNITASAISHPITLHTLPCLHSTILHTAVPHV